MNGPERALVGFRVCGCWQGFVMEREPRAKGMVASFLQGGGWVESMTVEDANAAPKRCSEHPQEPRQELRQESLL